VTLGICSFIILTKLAQIKIMRFKPYFSVLFLVVCSVLRNEIKAQSQIVFEDVIQTLTLGKAIDDTSNSYNPEHFSDKQLLDFGNSLTKIKSVISSPSDKSGIKLFYDYDYYFQTERDAEWLKQKLIYKDDSIETELIDSVGNSYMVNIPGAIDSTWFFNSVRGIEFKEDWRFNLDKFTCEITSKLYMPMSLLKHKEDLGPQGLFSIKPSEIQQNFAPLADLIITDVYAKQTLISYDYFYLEEANTTIDYYKLMLLMNATIEKIKTGKLKCYEPVAPFKKKFSKSKVKEFLKEEFVVKNQEVFPVSYKMFDYRFKLVEKWFFDSNALAFKKEALGMILMKRNESNDLNLNEENYLKYTFTTFAYIPFKRK